MTNPIVIALWRYMVPVVVIVFAVLMTVDRGYPASMASLANGIERISRLLGRALNWTASALREHAIRSAARQSARFEMAILKAAPQRLVQPFENNIPAGTASYAQFAERGTE